MTCDDDGDSENDVAFSIVSTAAIFPTSQCPVSDSSSRRRSCVQHVAHAKKAAFHQPAVVAVFIAALANDTIVPGYGFKVHLDLFLDRPLALGPAPASAAALQSSGYPARA